MGRQERDCRDLVDARGWTLVETFSDNDLSAYSGKPRPGFDALVASVKGGQVDVVVAWHPDRLTRHPRELEDLIDTLDAARCTVETVRGGTVDLSTRSGRTTARLVGAVARDESEAKAERLQAMHADKARKGEWPGGPRPYGYRPKGGTLTVDHAEAEVIAETARRVLAGESLHGICADLNARKVPTARGGTWRTPTLRRILVGPVAAGRREYRGDDVGPGRWPAIIDARTRRNLARTLDATGSARGRVARVSLLAGLARCGICGVTLSTARRSTGARVYVCPAKTLGGCGGVSIVADPLDELVAASVIARLDSPALLDAMAPSLVPDEPGEQLAEVESDLLALADDHGAGRISRGEWLAARGPLEKRRDAARARIATTSTSATIVAHAGHLGTAWPSLTLDQRRAIVAAVVGAVLISKASKRGPGFDDARVSVDWLA